MTARRRYIGVLFITNMKIALPDVFDNNSAIFIPVGSVLVPAVYKRTGRVHNAICLGKLVQIDLSYCIDYGLIEKILD